MKVLPDAWPATPRNRRSMLAVIGAVLTSEPQFGLAAADPAPTRLIVGFPPGQSTDVVARAYAAALQKIMKSTVYVDNRAGANGIIAAQAVKSADPDGHALLFGTSGQLAINPALYAKLPYSTLTDFVPVAPVAKGRLFLVVNDALPVASLAELVAYSKANPGKLMFGSGGIGITSHLAMETLKSATRLDATHVPYKGSPAAVTGLIGGEVQLMFDSGGSLLPFIASGKVRALAVSTLDRYPDLPQLKTVAEQGASGFEVYAWNAVLAPAHTPPGVVARLNAAFLEAGRTEVVTTTLRRIAHEPLEMSLAQLTALMRTETARWAQAASIAGIRPE